MTERSVSVDDLAELEFEVAPPALGPAFEAELAALAPVAMRRPRRQVAMFLGVVSVVIVVALAAFGLRRDRHGLPAAWIPVVASLWILGIFAASWIALVPKAGSMMARWRLVFSSVFVTASIYIVLGLALHPAGPSSLYYGWPRFARGHSCLELGLAIAILPILVGRRMLRGTAPVRTRWIAAAIGAASGCAGGLFLHLYCKIADGAHIGLIHGGVVACAAVVAAIIAPRGTP